ncbi:TetR family transcriptional regulator [Paraphotobacterium marinum]|uniref:TetR family transcriptional regulator n=1 Tax=Paraphotobacterium marinum TaxID=1755811 RepID=A0A220VBI5_9GAMM|nr:TetR-like C-terminal domain-containing protein [Paraphotobacterium marinum]ASK77725.1 TetR family transcriptional regulator [Paraphotobacterium marinum]
MARRNDHTREELVSITINEVNTFLENKPYHELSLRKLASLIGYVPSTLVNIFGSYDLLLLEVNARTLDELFVDMGKAIYEESDPLKSLRKMAYCYLNFAEKNPYRWQLIFQHKVNSDKLPEWHSLRINKLIEILDNLVHKVRPSLSSDELTETSRLIWASVHGITLLSVDDKLFMNKNTNGRILIDNFFNNYF